MTKKIIAFGASNSKKSINQELAKYTSNQLSNVEIEVLNLNDYEMPIYGIDKENATGIPPLAYKFKEKIKASDGIIASFAEHNGSYSTAVKNIIDWASRLEGKLWEEKPMLLLATSPGGRGGQGVLEHASDRFPRMGARVIGTFSLPSFHQNFSKEDGIKDETLNASFTEKLNSFSQAI